jgi:ferritin-like metal-binding protein YciE
MCASFLRARELGANDCIPLLEKNLEEEKEADENLTNLAEGSIDRAAA